MSITITWHGHSCFSVSADGYSIVLDPYAPDSVPGLPPLSLSASQVLCSHGHSDHGYTDAVDLSAGKQGSPFTVTVIQTFHDELLVEAPEAEAAKAAAILQEEMEGCVNYAVPLSTEVHQGKNWLEAH